MVAQVIKHLPTMWETRVQSLGWEDPLEKEMATHSSTLAWKIPWTEECGGLQCMGSQRVRHDWTSEHPAESSVQYLRFTNRLWCTVVKFDRIFFFSAIFSHQSFYPCSDAKLYWSLTFHRNHSCRTWLEASSVYIKLARNQLFTNSQEITKLGHPWFSFLPPQPASLLR